MVARSGVEITWVILTHADRQLWRLNAYRSFHEAVLYHNTIGNALGAPHRKDCSIPQGCPMSMMLTALLMRPWLLMMRKLGVEERVLADDIFLLPTGSNHAGRFEEALEATH